MPKPWKLVRVTRCFSVERHVLPVRDLKEHDYPGRRCWCQPVVERLAVGLMVAHNSMDGRELIEAHGVN